MVAWLTGSLVVASPQLAQAQWLFASIAQAFAALTALAAVFGVYKLQMLHSQAEAQLPLVTGRLRTLAHLQKLAPHDLDGVDLSVANDPADVLRACDAAYAHIRKIPVLDKSAGLAESVDRMFNIELPYNQFRDALERYAYAARESTSVRRWVVASMAVTAFVTAAAIALLAAAPGLANTTPLPCLAAAMLVVALLCIVSLAFVVLSSVMILRAGRSVLEFGAPSVPPRMDTTIPDSLEAAVARAADRHDTTSGEMRDSATAERGNKGQSQGNSGDASR